jgi:hypothetical protein
MSQIQGKTAESHGSRPSGPRDLAREPRTQDTRRRPDRSPAARRSSGDLPGAGLHGDRRPDADPDRTGAPDSVELSSWTPQRLIAKGQRAGQVLREAAARGEDVETRLPRDVFGDSRGGLRFSRAANGIDDLDVRRGASTIRDSATSTASRARRAASRAEPRASSARRSASARSISLAAISALGFRASARRIASSNVRATEAGVGASSV